VAPREGSKRKRAACWPIRTWGCLCASACPVAPADGTGVAKKFFSASSVLLTSSFLKFYQEISCCEFRYSADWNVLRVDDCSGNLAPFLGQDIAMGTLYFFDDAVGAKDTQPMGYPGRKASSDGAIVITWKENVANIAISKSVDVELTTADGLEKAGIVLRPGAKSTNRTPIPGSWTASRSNQLAQWALHLLFFDTVAKAIGKGEFEEGVETILKCKR
jgi:hypothetical protein